MERIIVTGCCGAGKSTFARRLHAVTGIGLIHLDQQYWKPDWVETDPEEWKAKVETLAAGPSWIIDGNYGGGGMGEAGCDFQERRGGGGLFRKVQTPFRHHQIQRA